MFDMVTPIKVLLENFPYVDLFLPFFLRVHIILIYYKLWDRLKRLLSIDTEKEEKIKEEKEKKRQTEPNYQVVSNGFAFKLKLLWNTNHSYLIL